MSPKVEFLTKAADCAACHTPGGEGFAGGRAFKLPFGTIYSTDNVAAQKVGIGRWSDAEFIRCVGAVGEIEKASLSRILGLRLYASIDP